MTIRLLILVAFIIAAKCVRAQQVSLIVPLGHSEKVQTARFNADNSLLVTGGADRAVMIWETFTGKKVQQLDGNPSVVRYAFFSPDTKFVLAGTDSTLRLWTVPDYDLKGNYTLVKRAVFSGDSKKLFVTDFNGIVRQVNLQTMKTEFSYRDSVNDEGVSSSHDSRLIGLTGAHRFLVRKTETGKIVFQKAVAGKPLACFFSDDGQYFITVTDRGIQRFNITKGYLPLNFIDAPADTAIRSRNGQFLLQAMRFPNDAFKAWDFKNYKVLQEAGDGFSVFDSIPVYSPFEPDSIIRWLKGELPFRFPRFIASGATEISSDGSWLRCRNMLINLQQLGLSYSINDNDLFAGDFTGDGKYVLTQTKNGVIALFNLAERKEAITYQSHADNVRNADVSPDGRLFLTTGIDSTVRVVELSSGRTLHALRHPSHVSIARFNKDGTQVLTNCYDTVARLWSAINGDLVRSMPGLYPESNPAWYELGDSIVAPALTIDSVAVYNTDGVLERYVRTIGEPLDPETNFLRRSSSGRYWIRDIRYANSVLGDSFGENHIGFHKLFSLATFSADEKFLALANRDEDSIFVMDIESNKWLFKIRAGTDSLTNSIAAVITQLTISGKRLFVTGGDGVIRVLDLYSGKKLVQLPGRFAAASRDGRFLVTANGGRASVYQLHDLTLLYSYIATASSDYLVVDPDFRFDGTAAAKKLLYYVCGNEVVNLDQLKASSWEPDLVDKIMHGARQQIKAKKIAELAICNAAPKVTSHGYANGQFNYRIRSQSGGLGNIQLLVNGKVVRNIKVEQLQKENKTYYLQVPRKDVDSFFISGSPNTISVKAVTGGGMLQSNEATIAGIAAGTAFRQPNLYLLSVGIGQYQNDSLRLRYPAQDALLFASALSTAARKFLNINGEEHVFSWVASTASDNPLRPTKYTILNLLDTIRRKAGADDILVVFFAGHGVLLPGKDELVLPTTEAESFQQINTQTSRVAIGFDELMKSMQQIKANKEILILDVCNSGRAVDELADATRRDIPSDQQRALDNLAEATGSCILAASAAGQSAYETNLFGQGLLSYSLLSSLKLGSGLSNEKFVQVNRWFDESSDQVKQLAERIGGRQTPKIFGNANFVIGIVDNDIAANIKIRIPKKVFGKSELRLDDAIPYDKLGFSALVDEQLKLLTSADDFSSFSFSQGYKGEQYLIKGRYNVQGVMVAGKIFVVKSGEENKPLGEFSFTGKAEEVATLAKGITERVLGLFKE